ncbi:MAG: hypothetical protein ABR902_18835 [Candidatus Korobacteraceae bacterium]|jgi:hypothetical protein
MKRLFMVLTFSLLAIAAGLGQSAPATQPDSGASGKSVHGVISVSLAKSIDSKKLKEGDEIPTKTLGTLRTSDGVTIPNGSMVIGHVTQATARSKGDPTAALGIAFDKIQVPGGKDMMIKGTLQAVGPNPNESGPETGAAGGNSLHAGNGSTAAAGTGLGLQPGQGGGKMIDPHATGVVGIKNLQLENSVLTSTGKEVKLDSGSQMVIKIE